jgi:hypothetical protein
MKEELKFTNIGNKESQKELIKEIMDLDAKDGLYDHIGDTNEMVSPTYTGEYPFPPKDGYDTVNDTVNDIDKFEQDAWNNYEHVEGNLYSTTFRNAFKLGYKKAKETLYTEEQVRKAIDMAREKIMTVIGNAKKYSSDEIIQSLKQPKKD